MSFNKKTLEHMLIVKFYIEIEIFKFVKQPYFCKHKTKL